MNATLNIDLFAYNSVEFFNAYPSRLITWRIVGISLNISIIVILILPTYIH